MKKYKGYIVGYFGTENITVKEVDGYIDEKYPGVFCHKYFGGYYEENKYWVISDIKTGLIAMRNYPYKTRKLAYENFDYEYYLNAINADRNKKRFENFANLIKEYKENNK